MSIGLLVALDEAEFTDRPCPHHIVWSLVTMWRSLLFSGTHDCLQRQIVHTVERADTSWPRWATLSS